MELRFVPDRVRRISRVIKPRKKLNRSFTGNMGIFLALGCIACFMALPLVYVINNAFKPLDELFLYPPRFFVIHPTLNNFVDLLAIISNSWVPFSRYVLNTVLITAAGTVGHVVIASLAAYVLAKHSFPGSKLVFEIVILSLMFSAAVTAIPGYLIMSRLGWIDTYAAVIVPAFQSSLGLYLMKQFMETIPDSLLEAARMDGHSEWNIFWKIAMPIVKPAWLTLTILSVQSLWGTTGGAYIFSEELKTLPFALSQITAGGIPRAGVSAAVSLLMMIVPVGLFILTQSNVIQTMSTSGMKD